ncbi:MAG: MFS transporter [Croceibacterium sp.]
MASEGIVEGDVTPKAAAEPFPARAAAWYAVWMIALANALDSVDRGGIALLIEPIKRDLHLSDTEVSLLTGFSFSLCYGLIGLPLSRLADTSNRKRIIGSVMMIWSLATSAIAAVQNFWPLFAMRGVTGSAVSLKGPNGLSMISDLVPRDKLPTAMAIYNGGVSIGAGFTSIIVGMLLGWVGGKVFNVFGMPLHDWQMVFLIIGTPGVVLGLAFLLTVREPPRRGRATTMRLPLLDVFRFLWRERPIFFPFIVGSALLQIEAYGVLGWRFPFFSRTFGWGPAFLGPLSGYATLVLTPVGLGLGAWLGQKWERRGDTGAMVKLSILGSCISLPLTLAMLLAPGPWLAFALSCASTVAIGISAPGAVAALQNVTPNEFRGQISALYLFTIGVIGGGLGPLSVALFTDYVFHDEAMLRYSLVIVTVIFGGLGLWLKFVCLPPYKERVGRVIDAERAS